MKKKQILVNDIMAEFNARLVKFYPLPEIRQFVYMLCEHYLDWSKAKVHLSLHSPLPDKVVNLLNSALDALEKGEPIQYIIGVSWFNGLVLKADCRGLIPRPETEELCQLVRKDLAVAGNPEMKVLDIGTGSGCIAIDIKRNFPTSMVTAIDISSDAIDLASENARNAGCDIVFAIADIFNPVASAWQDTFDVIVSNPPYVTDSEKKLMNRNVLDWEPAAALFVPDTDPLVFYRAITGFASHHLKPQGRLYFEINERFGREICDFLESAGFISVTLLTDINDKPRIVSGVRR